MAVPERYEIANPDEAARDENLLLFWFGAYGATALYVWASSPEDGLVLAADWLRENAPGHIVNLTEENYREAAEELGLEWQENWPDWSDREWEKVAESAEADLTSLDGGDYLLSYEWSVNDVTDPEEFDEIYKESHRIESERLATEATAEDVSQPPALTVLDDALSMFEANDLTPDDVEWVGSYYGDYAITWDAFVPIAEGTYRSESVDENLVIVLNFWREIDEEGDKDSPTAWFRWDPGYGFIPGAWYDIPKWHADPDTFNVIVPTIGVE